jgi:uncharacterized membrane protein
MIRQTGRIILWVAVFLSAGYFIYNNVPPILSIGNEQLDERRAAEKTGLILHLSFGIVALILGAIQFWPAIRNKYPRWHRNAGKAYIICAIIAALSAFYLLSNYNLPGSIPPLAILATLWLSTTVFAYLFARKKNYKVHKQFMTRSYVCALAFVFIRLLDKFDHSTGVLSFIKDDETRATFIDWMGWMLPVMITEFFLQWWPQLKKLNVKKA